MGRALWRQTGGIWPLGVSCSVTWYDLGAIAHVLQSARIRFVVEIGVEHGGLSAWLASYCRFNPCAYRGIDITLAPLHPAVRTELADVLHERDAWTAETVAQVGRWMAEQDAPALIICDGGDKPKELKRYAPLLRAGDVLLGHDYHNEYGDTELADMPRTVEQVQAEWLNDTLLCMFVRRA